MRRLLIVLCGLAVLAATAAGLVLSSRIGPERLRVELERRLAEAVGPIEIESLRPYFGWGLGFELTGVRSAGGGATPAFAADRVWITLAPRSLLRGEVVARRADLRGVRVRVVRRADGSWDPPILARVLAPEPAGPPGSSAPPAVAPRGSGLRAIADALPAISIEDGAIDFAREGEERAAGLRSLHLALLRDALGGPPRFELEGELVEGGRSRGRVELEASIGRDGPSVDAAVTDGDLAALAPWLRAGDVQAHAAGRVSATAAWRPAADGDAFELDLLGFDLALAARRGAESPVAGAFPLARLHAAGTIGASALRLTSFEWSSEPTLLSGSASIELPVRDAAKLALELRGGPLPLPALRDAALAAIAPKSGLLRERAARLRAGTLENVALAAGPTPLAAWRALAADPLEAWPESLAVEARVANAEVLLPGGAESLSGLGAQVRMRSERVEIEDARARIGGRPLPELSLKLSGMRALRAVLAEGSEPRPVPPLPGLAALDAWVDSHRREGAPPRWRTIDVDVEWIEHPALLRPIEAFTAHLTPANPGVHIENAVGVWGGVPFHGTVSLRGGDQARVDVDLALELPRREEQRRPESKVWCRGKLDADLEKLGDFQAERLTGTIQAIGDRVELRHGEGKLRPRGDVSGTVDLDLSRGDAVPYHARLELENGSLSEIMADLKMDGGSANGTADLDTELDGVLIAHHDLLADSTGTAMLRLRNGEILKRMNLLFSIAQASDTLNPFRSRETIPYDRIDASFQLEGGWASTDALSLQGEALRLVGTGRVNLVEDPHLVEAVIGIFYFRALDRVIGAFPILNRMLLGPDDNLVSTYFAVSGPWGDTRASIIPSKSLASGPGSFVLEGLPSFVRGGLATLERLFTATERPASAAGQKGSVP